MERVALVGRPFSVCRLVQRRRIGPAAFSPRRSLRSGVQSGIVRPRRTGLRIECGRRFVQCARLTGADPANVIGGRL